MIAREKLRKPNELLNSKESLPLQSSGHVSASSIEPSVQNIKNPIKTDNLSGQNLACQFNTIEAKILSVQLEKRVTELEDIASEILDESEHINTQEVAV